MSTPPVRTATLGVDEARWLVSEPGRDARATARAAMSQGRTVLQITVALRGLGLSVEQAAAAVGTASAADRMPAALAALGDLVFTIDALEQASDPAVSAWRAQRYTGMDVADLGCGAGVDLLHLSARASRVVGIDRDEARAILARHNVAAAGAGAGVVVGDAMRPPIRYEAVHADPSRREGGRRARTLADYSPPVAALLAATGAPAVGVVMSPAVNWADPDLPAPAEVEFIQRGNDLVEAMLWVGDVRRPGARATATIIDPSSGTAVSRSTGTVDGQELAVADIGAVLVEVAPAAVRARIHDAIGGELGAHRVATGRALLTMDTPPSPSPWYRSWVVEAVLPPHARPVREWLRTAEALPLEIATAGFDADPSDWWRAIGRPPRGPQGRRLLLARFDDRNVALALRPT